MKYTATMTNGLGDTWEQGCDTLLPLLMMSNVALAHARRKSCDYVSGKIEKDGVDTLHLVDEHWVSTAALRDVEKGCRGTVPVYHLVDAPQ